MNDKALSQIREILEESLEKQEVRLVKKFVTKDDIVLLEKNIRKSIGDSEAAIISTITNHFVKNEEFQILEKRVDTIEKTLTD